MAELRHASLVFWEDAGLTGSRRSRAVATALDAIAAQLSGFEDAELLEELEKAAHDFFTRTPNLMDRPFAETRAAGADEIYQTLLDRRESRASNRTIATEMLTVVYSCRPGLPELRRYAEARTKTEQRQVAGELRDQVVAALDRLDRFRRSSDPEAWAESATRAILRVLGDPDAENALKHRMKK